MLTADSINPLTEAIQLAVAPVFLLTGVAGMLNALGTRLARVIDRARQLQNRLEDEGQAVNREIENQPQQLIRQKRIACGHLAPLGWALGQPPGNFGTPCVHRRSQNLYRGCPQLRRVMPVQRHQRVRQRPALNDGTSLRNKMKELRHPC